MITDCRMYASCDKCGKVTFDWRQGPGPGRYCPDCVETLYEEMGRRLKAEGKIKACDCQVMDDEGACAEV
jgi:hypothetical protein